jgi:hypothetical protein
MKDYKIPILAAVVLLGYLVFGEYRQFKSSFATTQKSVADLLSETKTTVSSINDAIESLKKRLFRMEETIQQQAASENAEQLNLGLMKSNLEHVATEAESLRVENQLLAKRAVEAEQSLQLIRDSPEPLDLRRVKMHSGKNCLPCAQWKQQQKPLWEAMGWQVEVIEETTTNKPWPWFEVCDGDKCYEFAGPVTLEALAKLKAKK